MLSHYRNTIAAFLTNAAQIYRKGADNTGRHPHIALGGKANSPIRAKTGAWPADTKSTGQKRPDRVDFCENASIDINDIGTYMPNERQV